MAERPIDISIVVPVYNSSASIDTLAARVRHTMNSEGLAYELILADDRSTDATWEKISGICQYDRQVIGLRLAQNCGQWCATLAGMSKASGKYIVTIDDDLEYAPEDILILYDMIRDNKYSVVFGMSELKYELQGKTTWAAKLRNSLINVLWNKRPTDSFKIITRKEVYRDWRFLVNEPLDVFITHHIPVHEWGYSSVSFNKRHTGPSNHSLQKKIKLFFLYSSFFIKYPVHKFISSLIALVMGTLLLILSAAPSLSLRYVLIVLLMLISAAVINAYCLTALWVKPRSALYTISEYAGIQW